METNKTKSFDVQENSKSFLSIKTMGDIVNELDGPLINISSKKYLEWKNKKWVAVDDILNLKNDLSMIALKEHLRELSEE